MLKGRGSVRAAGGGRPSHRAISLFQPQRPHAHRLLHTHFPSTASTSLQAISCSCSVRSMRSLRSARRFRLIMNTWGRKAAPAQPPSSRPEQGQGSLGPPCFAHLIEAHLVGAFGRDGEVPRGLRRGVLHCKQQRGASGLLLCSKKRELQQRAQNHPQNVPDALERRDAASLGSRNCRHL